METGPQQTYPEPKLRQRGSTTEEKNHSQVVVLKAARKSTPSKEWSGNLQSSNPEEGALNRSHRSSEGPSLLAMHQFSPGKSNISQKPLGSWNRSQNLGNGDFFEGLSTTISSGADDDEFKSHANTIAIPPINTESGENRQQHDRLRKATDVTQSLSVGALTRQLPAMDRVEAAGHVRATSVSLSPPPTKSSAKRSLNLMNSPTNISLFDPHSSGGGNEASISQSSRMDGGRTLKRKKYSYNASAVSSPSLGNAASHIDVSPEKLRKHVPPCRTYSDHPETTTPLREADSRGTSAATTNRDALGARRFNEQLETHQPVELYSGDDELPSYSLSVNASRSTFARGNLPTNDNTAPTEDPQDPSKSATETLTPSVFKSPFSVIKDRVIKPLISTFGTNQAEDPEKVEYMDLQSTPSIVVQSSRSRCPGDGENFLPRTLQFVKGRDASDGNSSYNQTGNPFGSMTMHTPILSSRSGVPISHERSQGTGSIFSSWSLGGTARSFHQHLSGRLRRSLAAATKKPPATDDETDNATSTQLVKNNETILSCERGTKSVPVFTRLPDLIAEDIGGKIIYSTDDFFASARSLLKSSAPRLEADKFTPFGSWMDGWETRRRRTPSHDWCVIQLGTPGVVRGVLIDTQHFTGNYAPFVSVEGAFIPDLETQIERCLRKIHRDKYVPGRIGCGQPMEAIDAVNKLLETQQDRDPRQWRDIVEMTALRPGTSIESARHYFSLRKNDAGDSRGSPENRTTSPFSWGVQGVGVLNPPEPFLPQTGQNLGSASPDQLPAPPDVISHVRLNLFPDGGVARLRVHGYGIPTFPPDAYSSTGVPVNLASSLSGATVLCCSNEFFGSARNLLLPSTPRDMGSGWETSRNPSRSPCLETCPNTGLVKNLHGVEWLVIRLSARGVISKLEIDTHHFIGNFPESVIVEALDYTGIGDVMHQIPLFSNDAEASIEKRKATEASGPPTTQPFAWHILLPRTKLSGNTNHIFVDRWSTQAAQSPPTVTAEDAGEAAAVAAAPKRQTRATRSSTPGVASAPRRRRGSTSASTSLETPVAKSGGSSGSSAPAAATSPVVPTVRNDETTELHSAEYAELPRHTTKCSATVFLEGYQVPESQAVSTRSRMTPATHLRVSIYPDGGLARIRAWGIVSKP